LRDQIDHEVLAWRPVADGRIEAGDLLRADLLDLRVVPEPPQGSFQALDVVRLGADEEIDVLSGADDAVEVQGRGADEHVLDTLVAEGPEEGEQTIELHARLQLGPATDVSMLRSLHREQPAHRTDEAQTRATPRGQGARRPRSMDSETAPH
jgi:hypothetical protein